MNITPNGEHQIIGPDRSQIFDTGVNFLSLHHQCENPYCDLLLSSRSACFIPVGTRLGKVCAVFPTVTESGRSCC